MPARLSVRTLAAVLLLAAGALGAQPATPTGVERAGGDTTTAVDSASAPARPARAVRRPWQVIPFAGYAAHSPLRWGATPDRSHRMVGVQLARPFARVGAVTLAYAPNVVPVFVLTNNPVGAWVPPGSEPGTGEIVSGVDPRPRSRPRQQISTLGCEAAECAPVYGVAAVPLGIRADVAAGRALTVYTAFGMGLVRFGRTVPVQQARRTNVTFEGGGGVLVRLPAGPALQLGYKYHHLSNAFTAERNPGVDGDVLYAGLAWTIGEQPARR